MNPEYEVEAFLDFMSAKEKCGPKRPVGRWQDMSLSQQEDYLVYLRIALEHLDVDPVVSEVVRNVLLINYLELFNFLAHTESKLRRALLAKQHRFYRETNSVLMAAQERLIADL